MTTQMIAEPIGVIGTHSSSLVGVDDATDTDAIERLASFVECAGKYVSKEG
jgi:hypothetical protein